MDLAIGIDTGGTFTDGVIVDLETGRVISKAKALTTREDLKIGIEQTFRGLDNTLFPQIRLVSLSTTLATNSIVEGKGSRVGLLAAVPDPETFSFPGRMRPSPLQKSTRGTRHKRVRKKEAGKRSW